MFGLSLLTVLATALAPFAAGATPLEHLRAASQPVFRQGHTLPPLARCSTVRLSPEFRIELSKHWGYALELGTANNELARELDDPNSAASRLCALAASDPKHYPLAVVAYSPCHSEDFTRTLPPETWCVGPEGKKVWSPEAPDLVFQQSAEAAIEPLRKVMAKAPVAVILNYGEYALKVYGHDGKIWEKDERVVKAKGDMSWHEYISRGKAHQEGIVTDAFRKACPGRLLYIYYYTDGCVQRYRYKGWEDWDWEYRFMRPVSDLPSSSIYYRHLCSGWTGHNDMLTQALNAAAQQIPLGDPLSYNWLSGGWPRNAWGEGGFWGDLNRYKGFLKCLYTAGMTGGVAGYFSNPSDGDVDTGAEPPHWLGQMMVLARVHATFSHLEEFLRQGDLLPGPDRHRWSHDLPAYEFPTGDVTARVVARKHRQRAEWLITAWAADGDDREVTVTILELGPVAVQARASGSVYRASVRDGQPVLEQVDSGK
jgi:hypothetical protein